MSTISPRAEAPAATALAALWQLAGLPPEALAHADVGGRQPVLPSSFDVASAAQASLGAAALAAAELWHLRTGQRQQVAVDRAHAAMECTGYFALDGRVPELWDKLSGLYRCGAAVAAPGFVRIHANFGHHRDRALQLLGLPPGADTTREQVSQALQGWSAETFEQAAADAGAVVAAGRSFAQWDAHPQGQALAGQPVLQITPIEGAPPASPTAWPAISAAQRPLTGIRVLDLTRILAGPVAARCLAAYGADVLMVNGPHLPNIEAIADMSRGKRSALIDLREASGRAQLDDLVASADVFLQGYRPGALAGRGYSAAALAARRPGIVVASLSAYGTRGPWAERRGFDSLVQTASGFNLAEGEAAAAAAAGAGAAAGATAAGPAAARALPMQILDYAAGHLLAFGIQAALWRRATQGGSWQVQVSLAGVGQWLRSLGRVADGLAAQRPAIEPLLAHSACGFSALGPQAAATLHAIRHAAVFSATPACWDRPSMPPGSHLPVWSANPPTR